MNALAPRLLHTNTVWRIIFSKFCCYHIFNYWVFLFHVHISPGQPVHAHQDPRRLLLLRVRPARLPAPARLQLRQHGTRHD